jgi:hypothetical protein
VVAGQEDLEQNGDQEEETETCHVSGSVVCRIWGFVILG